MVQTKIYFANPGPGRFQTMFHQEAIANEMIIRFPYAIVSQNETIVLYYVGGWLYISVSLRPWQVRYQLGMPTTWI